MTSVRAVGEIDRALLTSLAVGVALRLLWAALVPVAPVSDSLAYHSFATTLVEHGVFGWDPARPDAYWAPGAAVAYALTYQLLGIGGAAVVVLNLAIAIAKALLLWRVTQAWFGRRAAVVACFALACWPTQILFTTVLSSEHLFDVVLLGALAIFERTWDARRPAAWLAIGVLLTAASFVRPTALPLGAGLAIIAAARGAGGARSALCGLVACATMALLIAPWTVRNYRVFGRFVPVSANAGANLWMGNNPDSEGRTMRLPREVARMNAAERDAFLGARAREWMRENPGQALVLALRKVVITHERETIGIAWNAGGLASAAPRTLLALKVLATGYWWLALLAGLAGVALRVRARGLWALLTEAPIALWGYFALVHALTVAQDRYHLASVPFIAALAGSAATAGCERLSARRAGAMPRAESAA